MSTAKMEFLFPNGKIMFCSLYMEIGETSKVNEIDVSGFYLFKSTENSGQIN